MKKTSRLLNLLNDIKDITYNTIYCYKKYKLEFNILLILSITCYSIFYITYSFNNSNLLFANASNNDTTTINEYIESHLNNIEYDQSEIEKNQNETSKIETIFEITYYTSLEGEDPNIEAPTSSGVMPQYGMVANNVLPYDTIIELEGMGTFVVKDHGGDEFDSINRLDIFIPRLAGEKDDAYNKRILNMGRITNVKGYIHQKRE